MSGWIKIERSVSDHWIFRDPWKFRCWIDLLLLVNHTEQRVEIKGQIFTCGAGETLRSLQSLATRWKCSRSKVRRLLKLLEADHMIELKDERKTTRRKVCNYAIYQTERNANETQTKQKRTQTRMNKKDKNETFKKELEPFLQKYPREMLNDFYLYWTEKTPSGKMRYEKQSAFSMGRRLATWSKNQARYDGGDYSLTDHIKNQIK